jgi:hypothetical protein
MAPKMEEKMKKYVFVTFFLRGILRLSWNLEASKEKIFQQCLVKNTDFFSSVNFSQILILGMGKLRSRSGSGSSKSPETDPDSTNLDPKH